MFQSEAHNLFVDGFLALYKKFESHKKDIDLRFINFNHLRGNSGWPHAFYVTILQKPGVRKLYLSGELIEIKLPGTLFGFRFGEYFNTTGSTAMLGPDYFQVVSYNSKNELIENFFPNIDLSASVHMCGWQDRALWSGPSALYLTPYSMDTQRLYDCILKCVYGFWTTNFYYDACYLPNTVRNYVHHSTTTYIPANDNQFAYPTLMRIIARGEIKWKGYPLINQDTMGHFGNAFLLDGQDIRSGESLFTPRKVMLQKFRDARPKPDATDS
jgi:hypothetical protein